MGRRRGNGFGWAALAALGALVNPDGAKRQTVPALRVERPPTSQESPQ
jgi:hypothetical protein